MLFRARRTPLLILFAGSFAVSVIAGQVAEQIVHKAFPSVVLLVMRDANGRPVSLGSGFFVRDGIVATNLHVVKGAASGYAKLVGQNIKYDVAGMVGVDEARDLALLAVKETGAPSLVLSDSRQPTVGEAVYVIGNPRGLEGTVSEGIISGVRHVESGTLLQITAPISPGSSGGPVLDAYGRVIGIAAATLNGGQNLNFAVPSAYLASLLGNIKPPKPLVAEESARPHNSGRDAPAPAKTLPETKRGWQNPHVLACMIGTAQGRSFADAERECRMAVLDPENPSARHADFGDLLRKEKKWNGAIAEYNAALRLSMDDPLIHQELGQALEGKGDLDAAIVEYRLAVRLGQTQIPAAFNGPKMQFFGDRLLANAHGLLGAALFRRDDLHGAVAEFKEVVRLIPDNASDHETLGTLLEMKGDHAAAMEECRTARELTPTDEVFSDFCKTVLDQSKK